MPGEITIIDDNPDDQPIIDLLDKLDGPVRRANNRSDMNRNKLYLSYISQIPFDLTPPFTFDTFFNTTKEYSGITKNKEKLFLLYMYFMAKKGLFKSQAEFRKDPKLSPYLDKPQYNYQIIRKNLQHVLPHTATSTSSTRKSSIRDPSTSTSSTRDLSRSTSSTRKSSIRDPSTSTSSTRDPSTSTSSIRVDLNTIKRHTEKKQIQQLDDSLYTPDADRILRQVYHGDEERQEHLQNRLWQSWTLAEVLDAWRIPIYKGKNLPLRPLMASKTDGDDEYYVLYHGTSKKNAQLILNEGARHDLATTTDYGGGFYLTPRPKTALNYGLLTVRKNIHTKGRTLKEREDLAINEVAILIFKVLKSDAEKIKGEYVYSKNHSSESSLSFTFAVPGTEIAPYIIMKKKGIQTLIPYSSLDL